MLLFSLLRALPPGTRPDLSVDGTIVLEKLEDVVYMGLPVQGQADSQVSLFKLSADGKPTGNLDSKNSDAVMDLMKALHKQGSTICMVTHDPRYARRAERTVYLFDGRIVDKDPIAIY